MKNYKNFLLYNCKKVPTLHRIHRKFVQGNSYRRSYKRVKEVKKKMGFCWRKTTKTCRLTQYLATQKEFSKKYETFSKRNMYIDIVV